MHAAITGASLSTPALGVLVSASPPLALVLWILARRVELGGRA